MSCLYHPTAYYSYIPLFYRLQRFIEIEITEKTNANFRNFVVLPTYDYKTKHITFDSSDLFYLMNIAGKIGIDEISARKMSVTQFTAAKNENNVPLKWTEIFKSKIFTKQKHGFYFSGQLKTDGVAVSVLLKKVSIFIL